MSCSLYESSKVQKFKRFNSVLSVKSVVKIRNHPLVFCSPGRIYSVLFCRLSYYCYLTAKLDYYESHHQYPACALVPGGHYATGQGFIWFLSCSQTGHKSVLSVKSVVKREAVCGRVEELYCSPGRIYSALFCRLSHYCYLIGKIRLL